ncbi:HB, partial [Dysosmobacter welbionis]
CGPGRRAATYLSLLADHGSMAARTWNAWNHKSVVHRPSGTEADAGTGVPAFRFSSVYRVWLEEMFSQTQSGSPGEILRPLPTVSGCLGQRR